MGLSEVNDSVLAGTQLETTPMLATTVKKKSSFWFLCSLPLQFGSEASRQGEEVLFFGVGDVFFPKILLRALDLKLTTCARSDLLEV